jgi:hypothetical protein
VADTFHCTGTYRINLNILPRIFGSEESHYRWKKYFRAPLEEIRFYSAIYTKVSIIREPSVLELSCVPEIWDLGIFLTESLRYLSRIRCQKQREKKTFISHTIDLARALEDIQHLLLKSTESTEETGTQTVSICFLRLPCMPM